MRQKQTHRYPPHVTGRLVPAYKLAAAIAHENSLSFDQLLCQAGRSIDLICETRCICMITLYEGLSLTTTQLTALFQYAQHSSAIHALKVSRDRLHHDPQFLRRYIATLAAIATTQEKKS